ncbi:hypothetical protein SB87_gp080 [Parapoxvirus red deer/HL953]|uniref:Virion morphogenesis core protein n=1 Tax=Parapoxvirus red deer/HL953 TaxID=1579460 RepID=A0A0A7MAA0_9POXV|nr:hypothetical protein SB87_gp080 [Parapoxvirus red deer/HL953]AIZ77333.1 hypothetical protein [Parapoxvirus red deer/HL953]
MDRLRVCYSRFYEISREHLARCTGLCVDCMDFETDVDTLVALVPMLESSVCAISPEMSDADVLALMKHCSYQALSFWFLKSGAVVKSVYNSIRDEAEQREFLAVFREVLLAAQTIVSLNAMYKNIRSDTEEIVDDSKKIMEIVAQIRAANGANAIMKVLQAHYSFLVKCLNKVFSDENYVLKLVAVFDNSLLTDKQKLKEYRDLLLVSAESAAHGIQCVSDIDVSSVSIEGDRAKYLQFIKKVTSGMIVFQNKSLRPVKFATAVCKIYVVLYNEFKTNAAIAALIRDVIESLRAKLAPQDLRSAGIKNVQTLVRYVANHRALYRDLLAGEYSTHEGSLVDIVQAVIDANGITYCGDGLQFRALVEAVKEKVAEATAAQNQEQRQRPPSAE